MAAFGSLSLTLRGLEVLDRHRQMIGLTDRLWTHNVPSVTDRCLDAQCTKCDRQMFGRTNLLSVTDRRTNKHTKQKKSTC